MLTRIYGHLCSLAVFVATVSLCGCQSGSPPAGERPSGAAYARPPEADKPQFLRDPVRHRYYSGINNDLLTAGLGIEGLRAPPPVFIDPLAPTVEELRRNSIHYNYNALVNTAAQGGFGTVYGPRPGSERVAGHEYLSVSRYANGDIAATLMVQVPDHFDTTKPCILTAPSSGSRGIYGAISGPGQWGLSHGCVVAYTDKGTGTGFYFGDNDQGYDMLGRLTAAGKSEALFAPLFVPETEPERYHVAVKHSHSGHNIEKDWGKFVLQSIHMAFYLLNEHHSVEQPYTRENTLVIASGISNGGAGALKAAEQDRGGWIDAVVVSEPNIQLAERDFGAQSPKLFDSRGALPAPRPLLDIANHFALYEGCASLAPELRDLPHANTLTPMLRQALGNRCRALQALGLLHGENTEALARAAQNKLLDYGVLPETLPMGPFSTQIQLREAIAVTYTSAYGRYSADNPACGIGFAFTDTQGKPAPAPAELRARLATVSSGIPPVAGIQLINTTQGRVLADQVDGDETLAAMLCLRGTYQSRPVQQGIREVMFDGDLDGKPAIIVHGRHDYLIHVNHSSRPYLALNRQREGDRHQLRYYEITHGQHFDALLRLPVFAAAYIPLHYYYEQAMALMWSHLTTGSPLPPSQVVYAQPGGAADAPQLPKIAEVPGATAIRYKGNEFHIP